MSDRLYCTIDELRQDLLGVDTQIEEAVALSRIRSASDYLDRWGPFIPKTEAKRFDGPGGKVLFVSPLLSVTSLVDDTTTLTSSDYLLYPRNRHWEDGPYTRVETDPDGSLGAWSHERDNIVITGQWGMYNRNESTGATVQNTTSISGSGTSLIVQSSAELCAGMVLLIESEQLLTTAVTEENQNQTTLTVKRGINGTAAAAHLNGVAISRYLPPHEVNWLCRQIAGLMHRKAQSGFSGRVGNAELGEVFYVSEFPKAVIAETLRPYRLTDI